MPQVGFEPTIPAFERAKTLHALDGVATVIGRILLEELIIIYKVKKFPVFYGT
jgi:hypothetical protein